MSHARDSDAHNFATNFMQAANSSYGAINIESIFINHRLNNYGRTTTNGDIAYLNRTGFASDDYTEIFTAIDNWLNFASLDVILGVLSILRNSRHNTFRYFQLFSVSEVAHRENHF